MAISYYDQCGNCEYYEFEGKNTKGHCSYFGCYYYPDDKCSHQKNVKTYGYEGSPCYITTMMCGILGFEDNCEILNTLRSFRNDVMQKDEKYKDMLFEYDTVGPEIARNLYDEFTNNQDKELVINMFNFYIQPTALLIKENKYDEAVERYSEMTNALKDYYGLTTKEKMPSDYDYKNGGHGKVKKLGSQFDK